MGRYKDAEKHSFLKSKTCSIKHNSVLIVHRLNKISGFQHFGISKVPLKASLQVIFFSVLFDNAMSSHIRSQKRSF